MDVHELVKGIEEFFINILSKAHSSFGWTEDRINNAFNWADFCEQIYKNFENNHHCRKKLDELLHSLSEYVDCNNQEMCFQDLKNSTDLLCKAFYKNPSVEKQLIESALLRLKNDKPSFETAKEEHNLDSLCLELLEALKPVKLINSDASFYSEVQAVIYLETLKAAVLHMTSEEEIENCLSVYLEKMCENTEKMEQFLQVLLLNSSAETLSPVKDVQEFALNWTIHKILSNKNCSLALFMWQHPVQLRRLCLNRSDFLSFYLDFLTECSSLLTSISTEDGTEWISRSSDIGMLSFDEILNHFRNLLSTDDDVCETTKMHLMNILNTQPESMLWKEIFTRVT